MTRLHSDESFLDVLIILLFYSIQSYAWVMAGELACIYIFEDSPGYLNYQDYSGLILVTYCPLIKKN